MNMCRYVFALLVLLTSACLVPHAQAATSCDSADLPYTLDAGTLSVPTTLDIGGVIPGDGQQRQRTNIFFQLHPAVNQNGITYRQRYPFARAGSLWIRGF